MLVLPPFFAQLRQDLGIDYMDLGLTITAYSVTTGLLQTPMGFLVQKYGGRRVLIGGLFVNSIAIGLVGFISSYWQLMGLMFLAGLGSSVFHPADYSILNARVDPKRLGRALSVHALGGILGFVVAPLIMVMLATFFNWRMATMAICGVGVLLAGVMMGLSEVLGDSGKTKGRAADSWKTLVSSPKIMLLFLFYALSSAANCGMVYFSVVAFTGIYAIPAAVAATALTAYQVMSMIAVLPGGWLADRVKNTELLLCVCFLMSGGLVVIAGLGVAPFWIAIGLVGASGALRGLVNASRDVSVRHAATDVSVGTLFGFVTTGYSGGQILGPPLYGWLLDIGHPQLVFWGSAAFSTLAIATMATTTIWPRGAKAA
jgi:MFS family permease